MRMTLIENGMENAALSLLFHQGTVRLQRETAGNWLTAAVAASQTNILFKSLLTKHGVHY